MTATRQTAARSKVPGGQTPYERLLGDAMAGDGALFTREAAVEAAWAVVDPILETDHPAHPYPPGSWGPERADQLIAPDDRWHDPRRTAAASKDATTPYTASS